MAEDATDQQWTAALRQAIDAGVSTIRTAHALTRATNTQDAALALALAGGGGPCLVCTDDQTAGRGRLGRPWLERPRLGLAASFALRTIEHDPASLPIRAGVAACLACEAAAPAAKLGLRWPNDIVLRHEPAKKLAGVLIEIEGPWVLVGVGVNVRQEAGDLPTELVGHATSIAMLGGDRSPQNLSLELLRQFDLSLKSPIDELCARWRERDVLIGTRQSFNVGQSVLSGEVEAIEPATEIVLRLDSGERRRLDPRQASLVRERPAIAGDR